MSTESRPDPWGLTPRQREALSLLAKHGHQDGAADEMGVWKSCFQRHIYDARDRMGARTPTQALVAWVRFEEACKQPLNRAESTLHQAQKHAKLTTREQCEEVT